MNTILSCRSTSAKVNHSGEKTNYNPNNLHQALDADVPEGWITGEGEGEYAGLVYYYNEATGESTWDHPLDEHYRCLCDYMYY